MGWFVTIALAHSTGACGGEEQSVDAPITEVALFKNGIAAVRRAVTLPGAGTFLVDRAIDPVHGTWWVESPQPVEARFVRRAGAGQGGGAPVTDLQEALAGRRVTLYFKDPQTPPAAGTMVAIPPPRGDDAWSRAYEQDYYRGMQRYPTSGRHLVVRGEDGVFFIDPTTVAYVRADGPGATVAESRRVLLLTARRAKSMNVSLLYLARGLSWAPSYLVDVSDRRELSITQAAVVRNELEDLRGAAVSVVTGFPAMPFAHVTSPLSSRTSWVAFFAELNRRIEPGTASTVPVMTQMGPRFDYDLGQAMADAGSHTGGDGVDLHEQRIGPLDLAEGEAVSLPVATQKAAYRRIVEWLVPDTRDEYGRQVDEHRRTQDPARYQDAAWDALRFENPFPFPMTTGPAMVVAEGRFQGQQMSAWAGPGAEVRLRITKALGVRARSLEHEVEGTRKVVQIAGYSYQRAEVQAELSLQNDRSESIDVVVRRRFSGEVLEADGSPRRSLLEEGVYAVNVRNEILWTLPVAPGGGATLRFRYAVLVRR